MLLRCETRVADISPTVIYHLATYGGFAAQRDTAAIFAANLSGTVHLLRACEKVGFDCFVNTGIPRSTASSQRRDRGKRHT